MAIVNLIFMQNVKEYDGWVKSICLNVMLVMSDILKGMPSAYCDVFVTVVLKCSLYRLQT